MPRHTVIDREALDERVALMLDSAKSDGRLESMGETWFREQAAAQIRRLPFSVAATALANGDPGPAKELCRREQERHGQPWAVDLWREIQSAVSKAVSSDDRTEPDRLLKLDELGNETGHKLCARCGHDLFVTLRNRGISGVGFTCELCGSAEMVLVLNTAD